MKTPVNAATVLYLEGRGLGSPPDAVAMCSNWLLLGLLATKIPRSWRRFGWGAPARIDRSSKLIETDCWGAQADTVGPVGTS